MSQDTESSSATPRNKWQTQFEQVCRSIYKTTTTLTSSRQSDHDIGYWHPVAPGLCGNSGETLVSDLILPYVSDMSCYESNSLILAQEPT